MTKQKLGQVWKWSYNIHNLLVIFIVFSCESLFRRCKCNKNIKVLSGIGLLEWEWSSKLLQITNIKNWIGFKLKTISNGSLMYCELRRSKIGIYALDKKKSWSVTESQAFFAGWYSSGRYNTWIFINAQLYTHTNIYNYINWNQNNLD